MMTDEEKAELWLKYRPKKTTSSIPLPDSEHDCRQAVYVRIVDDEFCLVPLNMEGDYAVFHLHHFVGHYQAPREFVMHFLVNVAKFGNDFFFLYQVPSPVKSVYTVVRFSLNKSLKRLENCQVITVFNKPEHRVFMEPILGREKHVIAFDTKRGVITVKNLREDKLSFTLPFDEKAKLYQQFGMSTSDTHLLLFNRKTNRAMLFDLLVKKFTTDITIGISEELNFQLGVNYVLAKGGDDYWIMDMNKAMSVVGEPQRIRAEHLQFIHLVCSKLVWCEEVFETSVDKKLELYVYDFKKGKRFRFSIDLSNTKGKTTFNRVMCDKIILVGVIDTAHPFRLFALDLSATKVEMVKVYQDQSKVSDERDMLGLDKMVWIEKGKLKILTFEENLQVMNHEIIPQEVEVIVAHKKNAKEMEAGKILWKWGSNIDEAPTRKEIRWADFTNHRVRRTERNRLMPSTFEPDLVVHSFVSSKMNDRSGVFNTVFLVFRNQDFIGCFERHNDGMDLHSLSLSGGYLVAVFVISDDEERVRNAIKFQTEEAGEAKWAKIVMKNVMRPGGNQEFFTFSNHCAYYGADNHFLSSFLYSGSPHIFHINFQLKKIFLEIVQLDGTAKQQTFKISPKLKRTSKLSHYENTVIVYCTDTKFMQVFNIASSLRKVGDLEVSMTFEEVKVSTDLIVLSEKNGQLHLYDTSTLQYKSNVKYKNGSTGKSLGKRDILLSMPIRDEYLFSYYDAQIGAVFEINRKEKACWYLPFKQEKKVERAIVLKERVLLVWLVQNQNGEDSFDCKVLISDLNETRPVFRTAWKMRNVHYLPALMGNDTLVWEKNKKIQFRVFEGKEEE